MQLSIIIVNYNVKQYLHLCLDSVFAAIKSMEAEVIVVDNDSQDDSAAMVSRLFPAVQFIANKENVGFSTANNQGVKQAKGAYICILNPDTVVGEDTFVNLLTFCKQRDNIGAVGIRLIDGAGHYLSESKRNLPTPKISLNKMMGDGSTYYANHLGANENGQVEVLVGAFMFLKKSIYEEVGGFDERYFMYGEDIDLSYTIAQAGYENYYVGDQVAIHFKGESTIKDKKYRERFYGAMRLFYQKHLRKNALEDMLVCVGLQGAKFASGLRGGKTIRLSEDAGQKVFNYYLHSDCDRMYSAFAKAVSAKVHKRDKDVVLANDSELVFDTASIRYDAIIQEIITLQGQGVTFKIIPKNSTFAIGSNTSAGRGEVISFGEE